MTRHARTRWTWRAAVALLTAVACERGTPRRGDPALETRATGVWDVALALDRTPLGLAGPDEPPRSGRGTLALIPSMRHDRVAALPGPTTHAGVYDIDFGPLGFAPRAAGPVATLVAAVAAPDTVVVRLPAGAVDAHLVLRGTMAGDSVVGRWSYGGDHRTPSGWGGTFVLRRHGGA
ncbi:MAG: hypothetical protein ACXWZS_08090 [Gemmatirosa sp.]